MSRQPVGRVPEPCHYRGSGAFNTEQVLNQSVFSETRTIDAARVCLCASFVLQTSLREAYELIILFYGEKSQYNNIPAVPEV
jgi:hypothetical protein